MCNRFKKTSGFDVARLFLFAFAIFLSLNVNAQQTKPKPTPKTQVKTPTKTTSKTISNAIKTDSKTNSTKVNSANKTKIPVKKTDSKTVAKVAKKAEEQKKPISEQEKQNNLFDESLRNETVSNIATDDINGEDLEVRNAALNALGKEAGTIVVLEPNNGKVLSIVNQEWAIRKTFKPCSTIKLVTGISGINEKVINEQGNIKNHDFPVDLTDSLAYSNNSYFQLVGANVGQSRFFSYARALGLGETTGINAEKEAAGKIPSYKFGSDVNRIYSHGDDFEVTAIQLATTVSIITNGGKVIVPHIPKEKTENASFIGFMKRELKLPSQSLQSVIPGMIGAVNYGTAQKSFEPTLNVAGKTGSCIADGTWIGLFASVSSVINPKLAVVVITKGSKARGGKSAEIASKIYSLLAHRLRDNPPELIANEIYTKPIPKVLPKISAKSDDAKSDDSDEKVADNSVKRYYEEMRLPSSKIKKTKVTLPVNTEQTQIIEANLPNNPLTRGVVRPRIVQIKN